MKAHTKPELKVSVISDYICPFCFIGHKRLDALRQDYDLKINWCFVEIHPETPPEGHSVKRLNYSSDHWDKLMSALYKLAEEEGIQLAEQTMTTNSRKALLLAEASKALGADLFYPLHDKLFKAYFIESKNIGDEKVLRQLAEECHIPASTIEKAWSDQYANGPADSIPAPLLRYLQYAGAIKAQSVPTFVFGKRILTGIIERKIMQEAAAEYAGINR